MSDTETEDIHQPSMASPEVTETDAPARQPREHAVPCGGCARPTWTISALCGRCEARERLKQAVSTTGEG